MKPTSRPLEMREELTQRKQVAVGVGRHLGEAWRGLEAALSHGTLPVKYLPELVRRAK